jgi:hypothetical protein
MKPATAPRYDWFKLVVTLVLIAILLLMLLRGCATNTGAASPTEINTAPTQNVVVSDVTANLLSSPAPAATEAISPTATATVISVTATSVTAASTDSVTAESATTAVTIETSSASQGADCNTRVPSRLTVGQAAQVTQRLNMRSDPSIDATILQTNPTGTEVEIIGGPVCTPVGERAYLWWQVRLASGAEGWSAEASLNDPSYLLQPIP